MNPRLAFLALLVIGTGACAAKSPTIESTHAGSFQAKSIGFMPSGGDPKDISSNLEFAFSRADYSVVPPNVAIEQQPDLMLTFSYTTRPALVAPYWVFAHFSAFIRDTETGEIVSKIEFAQGPWKRKTAKTVIDEVVRQMR